MAYFQPERNSPAPRDQATCNRTRDRRTDGAHHHNNRRANPHHYNPITRVPRLPLGLSLDYRSTGMAASF